MHLDVYKYISNNKFQLSRTIIFFCYQFHIRGSKIFKKVVAQQDDHERTHTALLYLICYVPHEIASAFVIARLVVTQ